MREAHFAAHCTGLFFFFFATRAPNRQLLLMLNFPLYIHSKTVRSHLESQFQACFDNSPLA